MNKEKEITENQTILFNKKSEIVNPEEIKEVNIFDQILWEENTKKDWTPYNKYLKYLRTPISGDIIKSEFINSDQSSFNFDGKFKDFIRIERKPSEERYLKNIKPGDSIELLITNVSDNKNFIIEGSVSALYETKARESLESLDGKPVEVYVKEMNPAGYSVEIQHDGVTLTAFMPNTLAGVNKLHNPKSIVGKNMFVTIESFSKEENTYIVSRRKYLQSLISSEIEKLQPGDVCKGTVTGTTKFGVFVEFNECLTGMIHKTNINPEWQDKIETIKPGTEIEFYVKEIIKDKIILTQIPKETVWDTIKINQVLEGKVIDNKTFGILISFDEETMGLIHTSEVKKISSVPKIGDMVDVKVVAIDRGNRKIFLTTAEE